MMGLYDGAAGGTEDGSAAQIAKLLGIPVVLVLDAGKSARSIAAVVKGFESFDPEVRFAGIVLNRVEATSTTNARNGDSFSHHDTICWAGYRRIPKLQFRKGIWGCIRPKRQPRRRTGWLGAFAQAGQDHLDLKPLVEMQWTGAEVRNRISRACCSQSSSGACALALRGIRRSRFITKTI